MLFNKSVSKLLILCFLIGVSSADAQNYFVEAAIKPTPSIKSSASFYVVSSVKPVKNHTSSPSFVVSGDITYGTPESPTSPTTPPSTSSPTTSSTGSSSSGGRGKYDASNWILERIYNELASSGDNTDDSSYTAAPKKRKPLDPFPVDEFEEQIPTKEPVIEKPFIKIPNEVISIGKELQTNIFKPLEEETVVNVIEEPIFAEVEKPRDAELILDQPGSLFVTIDLPQEGEMFPLYPIEQQRVTFSEACDSAPTYIILSKGMSQYLCWIWILILLIFINICLLFWQLLIVHRLILNEEQKENKVQGFFKNIWNKLKNLFIRKINNKKQK